VSGTSKGLILIQTNKNYSFFFTEYLKSQTMNQFSWRILAVLFVCHVTVNAAPSVRVKRADELSLDPVNLDVS
jgi:hypothetical protein